MTQEEYDARQDAKRDRLEGRAAKRRVEAEAADRAARGTFDHIPLGQPILVGHHSERKHRRDLDRANRNAQRSLEAGQAADRYEERAANIGRHGISSDDPSAVEQLQGKLAKLEARREAIKAHNKEARRNGAETCPGWMLSNLGANVRSVKARIAELEAATDRPEAEPVTGNGWTIEECAGDNRIRIIFDAKPSRKICRILRQHGFRWAPSVGAWQRHLNGAGRRVAADVAKLLEE